MPKPGMTWLTAQKKRRLNETLDWLRKENFTQNELYKIVETALDRYNPLDCEGIVLAECETRGKHDRH